MAERPLPPGWPDYLPGLPILMVFVGAPGCWQHAKQEQEKGFTNHLCLPDASQVGRYQWPTQDLMLVIILCEPLEAATEARLIAELSLDHPADISIRYWPSSTVIHHRPPYS